LVVSSFCRFVAQKGGDADCHGGELPNVIAGKFPTNSMDIRFADVTMSLANPLRLTGRDSFGLLFAPEFNTIAALCVTVYRVVHLESTSNVFLHN